MIKYKTFINVSLLSAREQVQYFFIVFLTTFTVGCVISLVVDAVLKGDSVIGILTNGMLAVVWVWNLIWVNDLLNGFLDRENEGEIER